MLKFQDTFDFSVVLHSTPYETWYSEDTTLGNITSLHCFYILHYIYSQLSKIQSAQPI